MIVGVPTRITGIGNSGGDHQGTWEGELKSKSLNRYRSGGIGNLKGGDHGIWGGALEGNHKSSYGNTIGKLAGGHQGI